MLLGLVLLGGFSGSFALHGIIVASSTSRQLLVRLLKRRDSYIIIQI